MDSVSAGAAPADLLWPGGKAELCVNISAWLCLHWLADLGHDCASAARAGASYNKMCGTPFAGRAATLKQSSLLEHADALAVKVAGFCSGAAFQAQPSIWSRSFAASVCMQAGMAVGTVIEYDKFAQAALTDLTWNDKRNDARSLSIT